MSDYFPIYGPDFKKAYRVYKKAARGDSEHKRALQGMTPLQKRRLFRKAVLAQGFTQDNPIGKSEKRPTKRRSRKR
jgi:hypothetical protein